jgi:hypothetical protein
MRGVAILAMLGFCAVFSGFSLSIFVAMWARFARQLWTGVRRKLLAISRARFTRSGGQPISDGNVALSPEENCGFQIILCLMAGIIALINDTREALAGMEPAADRVPQGLAHDKVEGWQFWHGNRFASA